MKHRTTVLREPISLINVRLQENEDATYQEVTEDIAKVWADIRSLPPSYMVEGAGWGKYPFPTAFYRVRIHYQPLVFTRIYWRQKIYGLAAPAAPDPTRQWLDFVVCEK
jgi:head-tail adaptor